MRCDDFWILEFALDFGNLASFWDDLESFGSILGVILEILAKNGRFWVDFESKSKMSLDFGIWTQNRMIFWNFGHVGFWPFVWSLYGKVWILELKFWNRTGCDDFGFWSQNEDDFGVWL